METRSSYRGISVNLKSFSVVFLTQNSINQKALHTDYKQTEIPNLLSDSCLNGGMTSCLMYTQCFKKLHIKVTLLVQVVIFCISHQHMQLLSLVWWVKQISALCIYLHRLKGVCKKQLRRTASFSFGQIFIWISLTNKLAPLGIHTNSWRVGYRGVLWVLARSSVICVRVWVHSFDRSPD